MTRVLLCYPLTWALTLVTQREWVRRASKTWQKAHPEQDFEVVPTWDIPGAETAQQWPDIMKGFNAVVVIESSKRGKRILDKRASQFARDAIVDSKECWSYRRGVQSGSGMLRIADIKPLEGTGKSQAVIYRKAKRKQP